MGQIEFEPWEPEESVGKLWHRFASRLDAPVTHNAARVDLAEGAVICVPRGSVHRFQNIGQSTGRLMVVMTPGGFEGFFAAAAREPEATPERICQIGEQFDLRFVFDHAVAA